jgi:DNA-binding NarL/FixJ family response regulator
MARAVLIADDNDSVRRALCEAFARDSDFEVCAESHDGRDLSEKALSLHPDLIVLDISMPVMNGLDAARELKDRMPSVPINLFTFHVDLFVKEAALPSGVSAVVSKSEDVSVLITKARRLLYRNRKPATPIHIYAQAGAAQSKVLIANSIRSLASYL